MADWNKPLLSDLYADFKQYLSDRLTDAAKMFNSATVTATNLPAGTIRWNSTSSKFEIWLGSAWGDLTETYGISISGSSASCTGNADTVDTFHASQSVANSVIVVRNSSGVIAGNISGSSASCTGSSASCTGASASCSGTSLYAETAGSAPASDVYAWAKAASPPSTLNTIGGVDSYVLCAYYNGDPYASPPAYGGSWQLFGLGFQDSSNSGTALWHRYV